MKTLKITKSTMEKRVSRFAELKPLPIQIDENIPQAGKDISSYLSVREENKKLKEQLEKYKSLELNVEFLSDENKNLQKILETEYFNKNLTNIILAKVYR